MYVCRYDISQFSVITFVVLTAQRSGQLVPVTLYSGRKMYLAATSS